MNLTLLINVGATLSVGVSVWLVGVDNSFAALLAIFLSYVSGLLSGTASHYEVSVYQENDSVNKLTKGTEIIHGKSGTTV